MKYWIKSSAIALNLGVVLSCGSGSAGRGEHSVRSVAYSGGRLVFDLSDCASEQKKLLPFSSLIVGDESDLYCELERADDGQASLVHWAYGTRPPGFRVLSCKPLLPARGYSICLDGGWGGCIDFHLDDLGEPVVPQQPCYWSQ
jgi:hypothetical protein